MNYSRQRRSGLLAKADTGKKPPHPQNQVESQLPRKTRKRIETSLPLQEVAQSSFKQSTSQQADKKKETVENRGLIEKPSSAVRPESNVTSLTAATMQNQTLGQKLTMINSEQSKRIPYQILPSTIPPSKVTTAENTGKTPLTASSSKPHVQSQSRNEISLECVAPSSAWAQSSGTSGKSAASLLFSDPPSQKSSVAPPRTNIEQSPQSVNVYSRLPENVFVVCMHFLIKYSKRPTSLKEKIKACKGCENRSKLKYALWNHNKRDYQEIRPYPQKVPVSVAFKVCPRFSMHVPCLQTQCSFAHGTEEQLMWTLEREGGELIEILRYPEIGVRVRVVYPYT